MSRPATLNSVTAIGENLFDTSNLIVHLTPFFDDRYPSPALRGLASGPREDGPIIRRLEHCAAPAVFKETR